MTKSTSFRLSEETLQQLAALAERMNISQAAVIESMIAQHQEKKYQAWEEWSLNKPYTLMEPEELWYAGYDAANK